VKAYLDSVRAVTRRNLVNAIRNPALTVQPALGPIVFLVAFGGGLSAFGDIPGFDFPSGYTSFQFVFILMQAGVFNGVFLGITLARDLESGFARRLMLAIEHRTAMVVGYVLAGAVRSLLMFAILFGVGLAAGMQIDGSAWHMLALFTFPLLLSIVGSLFASGIALRFQTVQAAPLMFMPSFMLLFLSPLLVPFDLLSGWIKAVARFNPVTYFLEAGRGFISGRPHDTLLAYALGAGMVAVFSVWAVRSLKRAEAAG